MAKKYKSHFQQLPEFHLYTEQEIANVSVWYLLGKIYLSMVIQAMHSHTYAYLHLQTLSRRIFSLSSS